MNGIELAAPAYFLTSRSCISAALRRSWRFLVQPPLTQQIQRLEQRIGDALFERSMRRTALTDAGAALLPLAVWPWVMWRIEQ